MSKDNKWVKVLLDDLGIKTKEQKARGEKRNREYIRKLMRKIIGNPSKKLNRKLGTNLRNRVNLALKRNSKKGKTLELLGCTIKKLRQYLESKFKPGMTWKNYGKWHIDHIIPCCQFNLSKKSEQFKCFNYKNLQPLWAKENYEKRRKYLLWYKKYGRIVVGGGNA